MSNYNSTRQMVASESLRLRVTAAAAGEGLLSPDQWVRDQMWFLASNSEWIEAWTYAKDAESLDHNPDTGARPGVINDAMILSTVQARIEDLKALEPEEPQPLPPVEPPADPIPS